MLKRHPCGEPAYWKPIAAPVCREIRRGHRVRRIKLAVCGFVMLAMLIFAAGKALQGVMLP